MLGAIVVLSIAATPVAPGEAVWRELQSRWRARLEPLLIEVMQFPTVHGEPEALAAQSAWLTRIGPELGLVVRDRETMTEIDLPGPNGRAGARARRSRGPPAGERGAVDGAAVRRDVQGWRGVGSRCRRRQGATGAGAADDGGAQERGPRPHLPVRLLVGTDEEGGAGRILEAYKKLHPLPDVSLVLDSDFPVVIGEKAWAEWIVTADERAGPSSRTGGGGGPRGGDCGGHRPRPRVADPSLAIGSPGVGPLARAGARQRLTAAGDVAGVLGPGRPSAGHRARAGGARRCRVGPGAERAARARGRGQRPAPPAPPRISSVHAGQAGADSRGRGLGLTVDDPLWGGVDTNFGEVKRGEDGRLSFT